MSQDRYLTEEVKTLLRGLETCSLETQLEISALADRPIHEIIKILSRPSLPADVREDTLPAADVLKTFLGGRTDMAFIEKAEETD